MAACVAPATEFDALRHAADVAGDEVDNLWPTTALRTYLWTLSQQTAYPIPSEGNFDIGISSYDDNSETRIASLNLLQFDAMAKTFGPDASLGLDFYPSTKRTRTSLSSSSRLRHTQSCYNLPRNVGNYRCSLPSSPRLPPPPARAPSPSREETFLVPDSAITVKFAHSYRTTSSLDVPGLDPRGRAMTKSHPSSRTSSPTPSIILTPPQTEKESRRGSVVSLLSSSTATGYSSDAPTSYDAASESESVWSDASSAISRPAAIRELVLETFRDNYREELKVPAQSVSLESQKFAEKLCRGSTFLTINTNEFLPTPLLFTPGAHGYLIPSSWSLHETLRQQAEYNYAGCHIFVTEGDNNAKYHGFYRIVQRDIPLAKWEWMRMPKKMRTAIAQSRCCDRGRKVSLGDAHEALRRLDEGEDALHPIFFQFLFYDWDLYRIMESHVKPKVVKQIYLPSDQSDSSSESEAYVPIRKLHRTKPSPLRIVTVDGINFEMAPMPSIFMEPRQDEHL